jgi:hypothetical protein
MGAEDIGKQSTMPVPRMPEMPYDPWSGRPSGSPVARMLDQTIFTLPEDPRDYLGFFEIMLSKCASNPNLTHDTIKHIWRDIVDLDDVAHSEGCTDICIAKGRKIMTRIALYMGRGDNAHVGLSITSAAISVKQTIDQTIRMPQQAAEKGFFSSILKRG